MGFRFLRTMVLLRDPGWCFQRDCQVYEASVLNALGVRLSEIRKRLYLEFFAVCGVVGSAIAIPLLEWRMKLPFTDLVWLLFCW